MHYKLPRTGNAPLVFEGEERWFPVPGFEERYEISDFGNVRGWYNTHSKRRKVPKMLRGVLLNNGYRYVKLCRNGTQALYAVHRLVLLAFCGPSPPGHQAAHLDGTRTNNCFTNLRWLSAKENTGHKYKHGTMPFGEQHWSHSHPERLRKGESHYRTRLTESQVTSIVMDRRPARIIAQELQMSIGAINAIRQRRTWKHLKIEHGGNWQ
jgi:hypothetical protein